MTTRSTAVPITAMYYTIVLEHMRYSKITRLNAREIALLWASLQALKQQTSDYSNHEVEKMQKKLIHIIKTPNH